MHRIALPVLAATLCAASCGTPSPALVHEAVILGVGEKQGEYLDPRASPPEVPLTVVVARVEGPDPARGLVVRISLLHAYDRTAMGAAGERIRFAYPGTLPVRGEIAGSEITAYEVER